MGHFSYTCHLSGIPITGGTKSILLPIFPKSHWGYDCSQEHMTKYGLSNLCSNDGVNMYFDELCFPIFGKYDDYGRLIDIENDDNTKVLEEYFGLSIDDICTVIVDGRKDEFEEGGNCCDSVKILDKNNVKHMELLKTSATWFHRDVYNSLSVSSTDDFWDKLNVGAHGILTALGFECVLVDKTKQRYNSLYRKDGLDIYSDGEYLDINDDSVYNVQDLKKYCNKKGVDIDISVIKGGHYSQIYDFVLPYTNSLSEFCSNRQLVRMLFGDEYKVRASKFEMYEDLLEDVIAEDKREEVKKKIEDQSNAILPIFYYKKIKENGNDFLKKNICDWYNVKGFYYPTGRYLYPVGSSPQDGDHDKVKILLEKSLLVLNNIIKEREEY